MIERCLKLGDHAKRLENCWSHYQSPHGAQPLTCQTTGFNLEIGAPIFPYVIIESTSHQLTSSFLEGNF